MDDPKTVLTEDELQSAVHDAMGIACPAAKAHKPKFEPQVKRFIRRVKEAVKPTHARIRFDTMAGKWAVLKDNNTVDHHFEYGVMTNVTFQPVELSRYDNLQCQQVGWVGIAEGELRENYFGNDLLGFTHLSFKDGQFKDSEGREIKTAQVLRVMSARHAMYK